MLKAITRAVSRNIGDCELTFRQRERVDYDRAVSQHKNYCDLLRRRGVQLLALEACKDNPDCCFVADTAVVTDEVAIIASPGAASRREEIWAVEDTLSAYREVARVMPPATLDGGDVLVMGKQIFVGRSLRTNPAGIESLASITRPFGYEVTPVRVTGSLHLTTACSALNEETVLINPLWIDAVAFARRWVLTVPPDEPWAASTMSVGKALRGRGGHGHLRVSQGRREPSLPQHPFPGDATLSAAMKFKEARHAQQ
jgi:dimethylargininase